VTAFDFGPTSKTSNLENENDVKKMGKNLLKIFLKAVKEN
jgi:hypothetical protein